MKGFLQRILQEIMKKNNTWNIRRLVDVSFVPSSKRPSVLYCKLTDFIVAWLTDWLSFNYVYLCTIPLWYKLSSTVLWGRFYYSFFFALAIYSKAFITVTWKKLTSSEECHFWLISTKPLHTQSYTDVSATLIFHSSKFRYTPI